MTACSRTRFAAALASLLLAAGGCTTSSPQVAEPVAPVTTDPAAEATALYSAYFDGYLKLNPILATSIGDPRYNDRLPNFIGPAYRADAEAFHREFLERARAIDGTALSGQDRLSYEIFIADREQALAGMAFPSHLTPLSQFFSLPNFFAQLGSGNSIQPFATADDYDRFLSRMDGMVVWVDQAIANMREGMATGIVQPKVLMAKTLPQLEAHLVDEVGDSLFYQPIVNMPDTVSAADRARLESAYAAGIMEDLLPAYERLRDFVRDEYLPACRDSVGLSALPGGADWYAYTVRVNTTTDLSPDEIHRIGQEEVARILGEMDSVRRQVGYDGDLPSFLEHLKTDDRYYFESEEQLIDAYREVQTRINAVLPEYFDLFPKTDYEIRPVEAFRAEAAAGASYQAGSPDGSRPGIFYINTYNLKAQPRFIVETLSLHEASPGHHFQISIQQEIGDLPMFRRFGGYTAYSEGWALYAESLGREMGLFTDPYQYYGRLSDEQLRAMRLVVDTGLHHLGWSRQQAIDFMLANSSMAESDVVAEVERYIAIPGQALAYKIGQRAITAMRRDAEARLGERFDLKAFHRQVLVDGALPMGVLERKIAQWAAATAASGG